MAKISFLLISLLNLLANSNAQPTIDTDPADGIVLEGRNLSITCNSQNNAVPVSLNIDGNNADSDDRITETTAPGQNDIRTFIFTSVARSENGVVLNCFASGLGTSSLDVIVSVLFAPEYSFSESMYSANEGERFVVVANVSANPPVMERDVEWSRDDYVLSEDTNVQFNATSLYILNVGRSDDGTYYISGNNSVGMGNASFELEVYFGPDFVSNGGHIDVTVGEPLVIDCTVSDSNPSVQYVTINGTNLAEIPLPEGGRMYTVVESVTTGFNGRSYTCNAGNGQTATQIMYTVYVNEISISSLPASATSSAPMTPLPSSPADVNPTNDASSDGLTDGEIGGIVAGIVGFVVITAVVVIVVALVICKKGPAKA